MKNLRDIVYSFFKFSTTLDSNHFHRSVKLQSRHPIIISINLKIHLLSAFSACGGLRTGTSASFDSLLSHAGLGHLGKGWIVRDTTTRRLPYLTDGLVYPCWNICTYLQLVGCSVADCQALTWHMALVLRVTVTSLWIQGVPKVVAFFSC